MQHHSNNILKMYIHVINRLVCKDIVNNKSSDHVNVSTFIGAIFRQVHYEIIKK